MIHENDMGYLDKKMSEGGYLCVRLNCPFCKTVTTGQKHNNDLYALVRCDKCKRVLDIAEVKLIAERFI